jgi:site-specific DNA-adenine methylase
MPCGNGIFTQENRKWIRDSSGWFKNHIIFTNVDYKSINLKALSAQDFVYLDPPYFNTTATYNESGGWTEQDDNDLFNMCDDLTKEGIKWAMSNVFENKGVKNQHLIDWVNKNNYNVHHFNEFTYSACGKGNAKTDEVLIMNY